MTAPFRAGFGKLYAILVDPIETLCKLADKEPHFSPSGLRDAYSDAVARKDKREIGRLYKLLCAETNEALARSVESQKRTPAKRGSDSEGGK